MTHSRKVENHRLVVDVRFEEPKLQADAVKAVKNQLENGYDIKKAKAQLYMMAVRDDGALIRAFTELLEEIDQIRPTLEPGDRLTQAKLVGLDTATVAAKHELNRV